MKRDGRGYDVMGEEVVEVLHWVVEEHAPALGAFDREKTTSG